MTVSPPSFDPKPLPIPGRDEKLPLPPPEDSRNSAFIPPPPPPPKIMHDSLGTSSSRSATTLASPPNGTLHPGLSTNMEPPSPTSPTSSVAPSADGKQKKSNPLEDLIETEKIYVDQLTGIIRKVAAAWSRSNLPPPDLDTMFRSIEGVYKANRSLLLKLKEIGKNPKALGDLLMRWIDDLEAPYTAYCSKYYCGFDTWELVQSNPRLRTVLITFSDAIPPPPPHNAAEASGAIWTLDTLFLLPRARLKYYKKLYLRLLKSTAPGRSDHRLLMGAVDQLDKLLSTLESRANMKAGSALVDQHIEAEDEVVIDMRAQDAPEQKHQERKNDFDSTPGSESSSARGSSLSSGERLSRETATTSISRGSSATLSMPITDLERRLATHRTLDIFTMTPKVVRLQMSPPSLPYTRDLRFSADVVVHVTPRATGVEVVHRLGHIFLLSDLFLVCERMTLEEKAESGPDGPDMWLCYPPLAGKVLRVSEINGEDHAFQVSIMRKENLVIHTDSIHTRDFMLSEFRECIEYAGMVAPLSKQPPPPLPPLSGAVARAPSAPLPADADRTPVQAPGRAGSMSPKHRSSSPSVSQQSTINTTSPPSTSRASSPSIGPGQVYSPSRSSSRGGTSHLNQPTVGPGQVFGPSRSSSRGASSHDPSFRPTVNYSPANLPHTQQLGPPYQQGPYGPPPPGPHGYAPHSDPPLQGGVRKSPSVRSFHSHSEHSTPAPPLPPFTGGNPPPLPRSNSYSSLQAPQPRTLLPSAVFNLRQVSTASASFIEPSPPNSPVEETPEPSGPVTSTISAQMKCKVFLKQHHAQWKSLGSAKLKLYRQDPTNIKQLVVEAENKDKSILISTIVLTDGVERVGKTGVAIELSDRGARTGIVYMIQLRNEKSAGGLFDSLLAGSDRTGA